MKNKSSVILGFMLIIVIVMEVISLYKPSSSTMKTKKRELEDFGFSVVYESWLLFRKRDLDFLEAKRWNEFVFWLGIQRDFVDVVFIDNNEKVFWFDYAGFIGYVYI